MRWIVALIILCCPVSGIPQGSAVPSAAPAELVVGQPLGKAYFKPDTTKPKQETRQAAQKPGGRKSIGKALIFVGGALLIIFLIF
ncbi:MAG TPA: hypothetical protein VJC16_07945 [Candidatus Nanoarchaeia archaeon]|nr:hypothetical protein [Candidatus Nanoarchaeia archaeon]